MGLGLGLSESLLLVQQLPNSPQLYPKLTRVLVAGAPWHPKPPNPSEKIFEVGSDSEDLRPRV